MESEKVKEIKKIADFCMKRGAICGCCVKEKETDSMLTCRSLMKELLTLINDLESENEALKNDLLNKDFTCFVGGQHKTDHCPYLEEAQNARKETAEKFAEDLINSVEFQTKIKELARQFGVEEDE